jgi:hypothetical protein
MGDDLEKTAVAVVIVFGALAIGGLMAATIAFGHHNGFLFALGASVAAWIAGHAMIFNLPHVYGVLIAISILLAVGATLSLVP